MILQWSRDVKQCISVDVLSAAPILRISDFFRNFNATLSAVSLFVPSLTSPNAPQPKTTPTLYIPTFDGMLLYSKADLEDSPCSYNSSTFISESGDINGSPRDRNNESVSPIIIQSLISVPVGSYKNTLISTTENMGVFIILFRMYPVHQ